MERRGIQVDTSPRSTWTGREKEVDTKIAIAVAKRVTQADMREQLLGDRTDKQSLVVVLVSGDGDLCAAVKTAIDAGIRTEVWAWSSGLSTQYRELAVRSDHILVYNCG